MSPNVPPDPGREQRERRAERNRELGLAAWARTADENPENGDPWPALPPWGLRPLWSGVRRLLARRWRIVAHVIHEWIEPRP